MSFAFSQRSLDRLKGVHPDLVKVVKYALELSAVDFGVSEGLRTADRQRELVSQGLSKTLLSRHITGHAVDLYPSKKAGKEWVKSDFLELAEAMKRASTLLSIPVEWGGDWKSFVDAPHWQLPKIKYPG